jgi:hypothetical protein
MPKGKKSSADTPGRCSQRDLALLLKVTDRRVRQLVQEQILPRPTRADELYCIDTCRRRLQLYRAVRDGGRSGAEWEAEFERGAEAGIEAQRLMTRALALDSTLADARSASQALQDFCSQMRFWAAVHGRDDAEKNLLSGVWQREEDAGLRLLLARASSAILSA